MYQKRRIVCKAVHEYHTLENGTIKNEYYWKEIYSSPFRRECIDYIRRQSKPSDYILFVEDDNFSDKG